MTKQDKGFRQKVKEVMSHAMLPPNMKDYDFNCDEETDRIVSLCTAEVDAAVRAAVERCAVIAEQVWKQEKNITKQNGLADGCLASAVAIRKQVEQVECEHGGEFKNGVCLECGE